LTALKTKKEVVYFALNELVKQYRRRNLLNLRRTGLWEGNLEEIRGGGVILIDTSVLIEFLNRTGSPADLTLERLISDNMEVSRGLRAG
jgi:hypothetical protein